MHFTHASAPAASVATTLQVFSVEVQEIKDRPLEWPLRVYGMVAARDAVDRSLNVLFLRGRNDGQLLTRKDARLQLTGPSHAIVVANTTTDPVEFRIQLKVKGKGS